MSWKWKTIGVTPRPLYADELWALSKTHPDCRAEAFLVQTNDAGATRVVLGYLYNEDLLPLEDLPGTDGRDTSIRYRDEE